MLIRGLVPLLQGTGEGNGAHYLGQTLNSAFYMYISSVPVLTTGSDTL